jgi:pimeloyl-ACP methyl ester carboxylesterase
VPALGEGWGVDRVDVNGLTIAFERVGHGPALILLHGGLSDHREWRAQLDGLADAFTVIAWDAPGCGGSDDPPDTFRMPEYARALAGFIEAIGAEDPTVLGLSWGSTLALELCRLRPDVPRALILTAAYAGWAGSLPPDVVAQRLRDAMRDLAQSPATVAQSFLPTLFTQRATSAMRGEALRVMSEARPAGIRPMLYALAEADLRAVLPTIRVPTLLLYGEEDERSPMAVADEMHTAIPGSTLVVLPEVGHQSNIETPQRFNDAVRAFLINLP